MRQLAGTIVLFGLISCAAATEAFDDESSSAGGPITMAEVTVEGSPDAAIDLDDPETAFCDEGAKCTASAKALENVKVSLAAPYLEVRAFDVVNEGGGSTMLAVRTAAGWQKVPDQFLSYFDDDPGCPSIEREFALVEIKVEQGALVVVTDSDRDWFGEDVSGSLVTTKARACRDVDGELTCGEPTAIAAKLSQIADEDGKPASSPERTFATKYWVDADGEIETEQPFDTSVWTETAPGT